MTDTQKVLFTIIGDRVQRARKGQASQERLAEVLDMARTSIVNLEAGRQNVPLETLYQIACELNVDIKDLLPSLDELLAAIMGAGT